MVIRYFPKVGASKFAVVFPGFILGFNILEAVLKDFQCFAKGLELGRPFVEGGLTVIGGPWNVINGVAGIICILSMRLVRRQGRADQVPGHDMARSSVVLDHSLRYLEHVVRL